MTIAITGATSMIGIATIKECIKQQVNVIAFARSNSLNISRVPKSEYVKVVACDLDGMGELKDCGLSADVLIHFGWTFTDKVGRNDPAKQMMNVQFTLDAVSLANRLGCKKFIGAGSQAEYGTPNTILKDDTPVNPLIPYGIAKYAAGRFSKIECEKIGMEYNWVRILSVYGEHDNKGTLLSQLLYNAKNNLPMGLSGCEQIWDYLHEDDAGAAFVAVAKKGVDGRVYNLGSGIGRPLKEYVQEVIATVNPKYNPDFGKYPYSPIQPMYLVADISALTEDTRWKPKIDFKEGIEKMVSVEKDDMNTVDVSFVHVGGGKIQL